MSEITEIPKYEIKSFQDLYIYHIVELFHLLQH